MKLFFYSSLAIITIAIAGLLGFYYQLFFPPKTISFRVSEVKLPQSVYHPGDTIIFTVPYCKYSNLVGQHTITLEDGTILPEYSDIRYLPLGCHTVVYPITLVAVTPPGTYQLVLRIDYMIRYLFFAGTTETYTIKSQKFEVIP